MMDLRDQFAMAAMQGLIAAIRPIDGHGWDEQDFAEEAYKQADAMIAERERLGEARKQEILGAKL